ncbi:MAG: prenyltransferase/squalene oxidase repeat-containing protein [Planctomycetota bacterium]
MRNCLLSGSGMTDSMLGLSLLLCFFFCTPLLAQETGEKETTRSQSIDRNALKSVIDRGANWIIDHQRPDGSWGSFAGDPGITAMALKSIIDSPRAYREEDGPFISSAVKNLLSHQQKDGGVYVPDQGLMNYKTAVTILALTALDSGRTEPRYSAEVARMRDYIAGIQCSEESKPVPYDAKSHINSFGGIGYGSDRRPDLSNTQLALEALRAAGLSEDSDVWRRASLFISRCQNHEASNDALDGKKQVSTGDGGFYYHPGESKAGTVVNEDGSQAFSSYGSMTYAAVKSLIYAGLEPDDPRIQAAIGWISEHWTVDENPGMATPLNASRGQMGYYYYLAVMARTLEVLGEPVLTDSTGTQHIWAQEIAGALLSRQASDGSWTNEVDRWWEGDPILASSYALQALNICYKNLED